MKSIINDLYYFKSIPLLIAVIIIIMVTVTGTTYAFLTISASTGGLSGEGASSGLNFQLGTSNNTTSGTPTLIKPSAAYANEFMATHHGYQNGSNVLQNAINENCINGYGNVTCKIYTFTIRNNSTAVARLKGRIYFTGIETMPNLRWAVMTSASVVSISGTTTANNMRQPLTSTNCNPETSTSDGNCWFETNVLLNPSGGATSTNAATGSYKQYWIIVWVNEATGVQVDTGTWGAAVEFISSNGTGITSTIET